MTSYTTRAALADITQRRSFVGVVIPDVRSI